MKKLVFSFILFSGLLMPLSLEAQDSTLMSISPDVGVSQSIEAPIQTTEEAAVVLDLMLKASEQGQWPIFGGALLMLLVWLLDRIIGLKKKVGKKALPWVAAALGISWYIASGLIQGIPLEIGIQEGFLAGATAVGLWEMIFKALLKDPKD